MIIDKIDFQNRAINELYDITKAALKYNGKNILFTAPVGSGKTIISGFYINKFIKEIGIYEENRYAFIWISTSKGNLLEQSKKSIESFIDNGNIKNLSDMLSSREINPNDIIFINWESVWSDDNIARRGGEKPSLQSIVKKSDVKIILLIDEAHENVGAEQTNEVINIINPELTIHITATPKYSRDSYYQVIKVNIEDVIEEGIVKKGVVINEGLKDNTKSAILDKAINKREEIERELVKYDRKIKRKPLVLIQIANDSKKDTYDDKTELTNAENIKSMLLEKEVDNSKIGIWLAEKENNQNIEEDIKDSDIEFLIFKQAIATGWDCPRSHILVRFRETESTIFDIQTIGRILRTVERKHYDNDLIDTAYIYTEYDDLEYKLDVDEDMQDKILTEEDKAILKDRFEEEIEFTIPMYKLNRNYNYGIEAEKVGKELLEELKKRANTYNINQKALLKKIPIAEASTEDIEKEDMFLNKSFIEVPKNKFDIINEFSESIKKAYSKYNFERIVLKGLKEHNDYSNNDIIFLRKLYLSNKEQINLLIENIIKKYEETKKTSVAQKKYFTPLKTHYYKKHLQSVKSYAYDKMPNLKVKYTGSSSEDKMGNWLIDNDNVMWWFKNGVHGDNFSIHYLYKEDNGESFYALYYPDFFIIDKKENLYIVDVKAPIGEEDYPHVDEKYRAGKEFEKEVRENIKNYFNSITLSVVKFIEEEPFICIADEYNEDFDNRKSWIKLNEII